MSEKIDLNKGTSDELVYLWGLRDNAKTPEELRKAQAKIDDYFLPPKQKAVRKKPKVRFNPDDEWGY